MGKNRSYLSERRYQHNIDRKYDDKKLKYWEQVFGKETLSLLLENNEKFRCYLNADEYDVKEEIVEELPEFFRNEAAVKHDRVKWEESGTERALFFTEFYDRILEYGIYKLKGSLENKGIEGDCPTRYDSLEHDFSIHLAFQLQNICLRTLISEMHTYKQKGLLSGKDGKEEYNYFCGQIVGSVSFGESVFTRFPVLCRCVEEKAGSLASYYAEVLAHFEEDRERLWEMCSGAPGQYGAFKISKISGDFSDLHQNGKQVLKLQLEDGTELFYKPRSMENEKSYQKLLNWISMRTGTMQRSYPFLSFPDHSWSSAVGYKSCKTEEQLKQYYIRLGEQLFLAYLLGTKDLHYENLVASGEYPMLIDLENLVNIQHNRKRTTADDEVYYQLSQSVLFMGILPFYFRSLEWQGVDTSAVSGTGGQVYPFRIPSVMGAGTSEMYIGYKNPVSEDAQNRAMLNGEFRPPYLYEKELVHGFFMAYETVMKEKQEFSKELQKLQKIISRFLTADTQRYSMVLSSSYHPELLLDGADRELFLYTMWKGRKLYEEPMIKSEVECLLDGDIPYFYYALDSTALCTVQGKTIEHYFSEPAIEILYRRLALLNRKDLEKQCTYIRMSLALMLGRKEGYKNLVYPVRTWRLRHRKRLDIKLWIRRFTDRVLQYAVWNEGHTEVSWAVMQMDPYGSPAWNMKGMDMYLYHGLAGMLLLFYQLDSAEGLEEKREEIQSIFQALKGQMFRYTDEGCASQANLQSKNTGAYEGESSILYVYLALYRMSKENSYLDYAVKHAEIVNRLLDEDDKYDLLYRNAGAAQVLLYMFELTKDDTYLCMAERAVTLLAEAAQKQDVGIGWITDRNMPPLGGMAHGNAGILMPVMQLWSLTRKCWYEKLAEEIWQYENSLYDSGMNNWTDIRGTDTASVPGEAGTVAWCHGAAGILMSRVFCCSLLGEIRPSHRDMGDGNCMAEKWQKRLLKEIKTAYQTSVQYWARDSWSLCHGICGNLWILEWMEQQEPENCGIRNDDIMQEAEGILYGDEIRLLPQELINPGMMNGYGGILYFLLHRDAMGNLGVNRKNKKMGDRKHSIHVQMLVLR